MAVYMVKCPHCGSPTELDEEKDFCFCTECGMKIPKEDAELFVPDPAPGAEASEAPAPAAEEPEPPAPPSAPDFAPKLTFGAAPDAVSGEKPDAPAVENAPAAEPEVFSGEKLNNAEQVNYLVTHQPQRLYNVVFHNSDECAAYVNDLHGLIMEAQRRYARMNHAEEATCLDFLDRAIDYCDYLDTKRLRFVAGSHREKGRTVEDFGFYPVSKDVLHDLKQAREELLEAYNCFFKPKIAAAKSALDETRTKIKALPASARFFHAFCTPVMGILTAILTGVGVFAVVKGEGGFGINLNTLILVVGGVLFLLWAVLAVRWLFIGRSARQLYKAAEDQMLEIRTYKAKLRG